MPTAENLSSGPSTALSAKDFDALSPSSQLMIKSNDEDDFEFEEATAEVRVDSYLDRVTKDFD